MLDPAALLDRAPGPIRRLAYRIAAGRGPLGRLADRLRFRFTRDDVPKAPEVAAAPIRLAIGPANSAGQGYLWARAAERLPGVAAVALHENGRSAFSPRVDVRVPVAVYQRSREWQDALEAFLVRQTHVIWESGLPLLGRRYDDVATEVARLRDRGVRAALLFHGSDIRPPLRHAAESPWSPFRQGSGPTRTFQEQTAANAALAAGLGLPVFVSTPDLLRWMPHATWCPVVVEPAAWREAASSRAPRRRPVVAHAPSLRWLKGTDLIEPVVQRLADEGLIEYRRILGVPHAEMPAFYADADVVLDQFVLGIYGVAACEAMASGRLVLSHVDGGTRARVLELTGRELPIHEVTLDTLEAELRRVVAEPEAFEWLRDAGPAFVEELHDGRRSAAALAPFLGVDAGRPSW